MIKIAVLMNGLVFDSQKKIINGIKKAAIEKGCNVFVFTCMGDVFITNEFTKGEFSIFSLPEFENFDGIILASNTIMHQESVNNIIRRIQESKVPAVSIENQIEGFTNIYSDNKLATKNMVDHLIYVHKYERIVFLAGPKENFECQQRLEGYLQAMEEAGLEVPDNYILYQNFNEGSGEAAACYFVDTAEDIPQAIVCANDFMAISTAGALINRKFNIPEQIAITGFDYTEDAILYSPQISSVKRFQEETGYMALEHLYNVITEKVEPIINIEIKTEIITSTSCGCNEYFKPDEAFLRKKLIDSKNQFGCENMMLKNLYSKTIPINSFEDYFISMEKHFGNQFFRQFFLCMKNKKDKKYENIYSFSKESVLKVAYNNNSDLSQYKNIFFQTKRILPDFLMDFNNNPKFYFVMPIHTIDYTIGYAVMDSEAPLISELFYTSILSIGLLYENTKNKLTLKSTIEKLDELWIHDSLTNLYNRNGFFKHSKEIMKYCIKNNKMLLVLFIDVDNLKYVNDNFGHYEGDQYLKTMADILVRSKTKIRLVMRYGGDEFVIFSPDHTEESAKKYMESIKSDIKKVNQLHNKPFSMDMSIGYILKKIDKNDSPESLIKLADKEMYIEKNKKAN